MAATQTYEENEAMHTPIPQPTELIRDGLPDWEAIDFDVLCPRCNYNLRMLTAPRCAECGLDFEWHAALDRGAFQSDWLFEHHWRERPIRSWIRMLIASLRPKRLARRVPIYRFIDPTGLWILLLSAPVAQLLVIWGAAELAAVATGTLSRPFPGWWMPQSEIDRLRIPPLSDIFQMPPADFYSTICRRLAAWAGWLQLCRSSIEITAMLTVLLLLSDTRMQCKVRPAQVLRVVAYVAVPIAIWRITLLAGWVTWMEATAGGGFRSILFRDATEAGAYFLGSFIIMFCFLSPWLREYLRIPSGRSVAAVTAFIAALAEFAIVMRLVT